MESGRRPILFVSYPDSGLMNSLLVLAAELSARGVPDLWFATDENRRSDVESLTVGTPVEFVSMGEVIPELSSGSWDDEAYRQITQRSRSRSHRALIRHTFVPAQRAEKYRRLAEAVEKIQPALLVVDSICQYGYDLAITKRIPYVLSEPFLVSNFLTAHTPFTRSYTPRGFPAPHTGLPLKMSLPQRITNVLFRLRTLGMFLTPSMVKLGTADQRLRKELGIAPEANGAMSRIDHAAGILCYSVPELDYPFPIPEKVHMVGAMIPPLPQAPDDRDLSGWLDAQHSVIFMGFGTVTRLTREQVGALVEVARRLADRHQILWKLPAGQQHLLPPRDTLPANLRIESWVPSQLDVLAHPNVKLFLTHAGGNGFHEGLYFGKPLVIRPLWVDCFDTALRSAEFGLSLTLDHPETVDPDDVVDKLTRVLGDPSFGQRAEHIGRLLREAGGRHASADLIMKLAASADLATSATDQPGRPRP
jgi:polyene glycosyltransferase